MDTDTYEWVSTHLDAVSRTFALSIKELPHKHERQMKVAYLLCRIPDTIEDTLLIDTETKVELLDIYKSVLKEEESAETFVTQVTKTVNLESIENPDWDLVLETSELITIFQTDFSEEEQDIMRKWVLELTEGMQEFVSKTESSDGVRIQTKEELDTYCYYVAGTVGHMIIDLLDYAYDIPYNEYTFDEVHELAENYGLMLQYINIAKDVYDDYESEDNIYIPQELLDSVGLGQIEFVEGEHDKSDIVMTKLADHIHTYLTDSKRFLEWIQQNHTKAYKGWAIPHFLAVATFRELKEQSNLAVKPEEVKIDREEVYEIMSEIPVQSAEKLQQNILAQKTV